MADKKFNVGINHGKEAFYANGVSININQDKITLDFRQTTQRLDDFGEKAQTTLFTHHNALLLDPPMAKGLFNILKQGITNYEKKFGKINIPKPHKVKEKVDMNIKENYIG